MQDYQVHIKHLDGHYEIIPYFCLPANDLNDVIAPSCYSCFDYPNALADLVVSVNFAVCGARAGAGPGGGVDIFPVEVCHQLHPAATAALTYQTHWRTSS